ncbi:single-stranded-DNA-specific exonuclease RecJ [Flavihumibacter rivuli]|uniref:single-stranded-DNA-specific exonuclease RecJ n=1 Tax=Flavihumibacter rivuli TaxID=2838156 RepID=UPI001BDDFD3A|nr:single-stranded-DNA-specific exonuclease RecJ [Flavihumibacter rivuli]ULQ56658.1 single-stranded-DNA-specific exonuclease RecJ [Flavihumibacter rivuli]
MEKRWKLLSADGNEVTALQDALKVNAAICKILVQRGIRTFDSAKSYFNPSLGELHSPWLMKDMEKAVDRIIAAMASKERIMVFGDYDVDGTTAVASMFQFLSRIYISELVSFYIPHRYKEGYGVSRAGIDHASENNVTLIISLDCGIKSVELIRYAASLGIEFIVCDHHLPDEELPPAVAILNPKQPECPYPYKELCGAGVGFKLINALSERLALDKENYLCFLDLVATAIAADIVPITGENRLLAYFGIKKVNENPSPGIKALIEQSEIKVKQLTINSLVFVIAPRVNAAGRMDDASLAVKLFIENEPRKAMELAKVLHSHNDDRKEADFSITEEALDLIRSSKEMEGRKSTVVYQPHWHKGVVGIVASRLIDQYYRPTVVLTRSGEIVAGSARSVPGFNLYEAIHACREHLLGYGGHFAAAGMTLHPDNVDAFSLKFEEVVAATIAPHQLIPELVIDAEVEFRHLRPGFYNIIKRMEPFGPDNARPVFLAKGVRDTGRSKVVKDLHIKFSLKQGDAYASGIGFGLAGKFHLLESGKPVDIVFTLEENEWNNTTQYQIKVIDLRSSE